MVFNVPLAESATEYDVIQESKKIKSVEDAIKQFDKINSTPALVQWVKFITNIAVWNVFGFIKITNKIPGSRVYEINKLNELLNRVNKAINKINKDNTEEFKKKFREKIENKILSRRILKAYPKYKNNIIKKIEEYRQKIEKK